MKQEFRADGDSWRVTANELDARRAVQTIVFHCVSNSNRPYRVIEVPEPVLKGRSVERLSEDELGELFGRSQTMDYSHDASAEPGRHGV